MPRRNLFLLLLASVVSLMCYQQVQNNRYSRVLADAMEKIGRRHLEPIRQEELFLGAMEGMLRRLGDPYSEFIAFEDLPEFHRNIDQEFGGVGMEVGLDPKTRQLTVMCPLVGTPAYEAGIRAGDKILKIDGQSTQGLSLKDAVGLMHGRPGTSVRLSILHESDQQPVEIEIVRAVIQVDTVLGDTRNADGSWNFFLEGHPGIGYLRISAFGKHTAEELRRALQRLVDKGMQGLILDLRNDPGGRLKAATDVCDMFIDSGVIVTTRGRDGRILRTIKATRKGTFGKFPMAVLVNQLSASASEIVAACLQDHHPRTVVVGQRTWGKGTVQEEIYLKGGSGALKLTTSSYWRPSGKNIHRRRDADEHDDWGVTPDKGYEVVVEGEELTRLRLWRLKRDVYRPSNNSQPPDGNGSEPFVDPQLAKAVRYVQKEIGRRP